VLRLRYLVENNIYTLENRGSIFFFPYEWDAFSYVLERYQSHEEMFFKKLRKKK